MGEVSSKRCCVLIPYWNAGASLLRSLESIDAHDSVDVLVVDDGSDAQPASEVLAGFNSPLAIKLIRLDRNVGIARALNAGLDSIRDSYEYIARLDCGDTCINNRLAIQIRYLDEHNDCSLVGSWAEYVAPSGKRHFTVRNPTRTHEIRRRMFVNSALIHPSIMFRSRLLSDVGLYPIDRPAAEDYAFFMKVIQGHEVANIPKVLVRYVVDPQSVSSRRRHQQLRSRLAILVEYFELRPMALYGLVRTSLLLGTPRAVSVFIRRLGGCLR